MNETPGQNQPPTQPPAQPNQTPIPPVQQPTLPAAVPPHSNEPKKGSAKSPYLYALVTFLLGIGIGYLLIVLFPGNKTAENAAEKSQTAKALTLPKDAVKVAACVDKKGELHAVPADLPQGPMYMVDNDKVVGLEYVLNKEAFETGEMYEQLNALQAGVNHMQVSSMSASYDGVAGDYYVVDLYTVDKQTKDTIKCSAAPSPTAPEATPSAEVSIVPSVIISQPATATPIPSATAPSPLPSL